MFLNLIPYSADLRFQRRAFGHESQRVGGGCHDVILCGLIVKTIASC